MKRGMVINIGVTLSVGLLLASCGKNAKPVTGGGPQALPQYTSSQLSPQVGNLVNTFNQMRMDQGIRTFQPTGTSSQLQRWGCTVSNTSNPINITINGNTIPLFQINFSACNLSLTQSLQFQTVTHDEVMPANPQVLITKEQILNQVFDPLNGGGPNVTLIAKECNGSLSQISASVKSASSVGINSNVVPGITGNAQMIEHLVYENCTNGTIKHVRRVVVDTSLPLIAQPLVVETGKINTVTIYPGQTQDQYIFKKIEKNIFTY